MDNPYTPLLLQFCVQYPLARFGQVNASVFRNRQKSIKNRKESNTNLQNG